MGISTNSIRALLLTDLTVDLRVPPGQHLYGPPVSDGLVITSVTVDDNDHVIAQPAYFPPTHEMTLEGTGETLHVYEGDVRIQVPLLYGGRRVTPNADGTHTIDITGTIRWQSCDDHTCHIPRSETFSLTVGVEAANVPQRRGDLDPTNP
ncbi:MAG: protein-disulfide reductase DsbD domain-containing protein [Ilumatobacter sp.]